MNKYTKSDGQFINDDRKSEKKIIHFIINCEKTDYTNFQVFGKDKILQLLNRPEAVGLQITNGICEEGQNEVILSAIDKDGKTVSPFNDTSAPELVYTERSRSGDPETDYLANGPRCPKTC